MTKFSLTIGDTTKGSDGDFLHPADKILFDSEELWVDLKNQLGVIPQKFKDFTDTYREHIIGLKPKIENFFKLNNINNETISSKFQEIKNKISSQDISDLLKNLGENIYGSLDQELNLGNLKVKKIYIMLYMLAVSQTNIYTKDLSNTIANTKVAITETVEGGNLAEVIVKPEKSKRVVVDIKPIENSSKVHFPTPSLKNPSIIMPKTAATTIDTNGVARNLLLPGVEKTADGTTLCAKTAREAAETIYGSNGFIVKERYAGDNDAIGYYLRAQENKDQLESEYPLFAGFRVANEITKDKELPKNIKYDIDSLTINPDQFGILVTTQNDGKITDGHQVLVNNMYHADGSVEGTYVYDPYLHNAVKKRHKDLTEEEKKEYKFDSEDGYFMPINTYLKFCEYKGRVPLGTMIYSQPKVPAQLITNKRIDPEIDIRESHFKQFNDLYPKVKEYISEHRADFGKDFLETTYTQDLANFSQESKLSPFAINRRGFKGIGQMNDTALEEVYNQYPFIKEELDSKEKIEDLTLEEMILVSKIYKNGVIYGQLMNHHDILGGKSIYEMVKKEDLMQFTLAAYNRGSTRLSKLLANYVSETHDTHEIYREDFEQFYLDKIERRNGLTKLIKGYHGYVELFGEELKDKGSGKIGYVTSIMSKESEMKDFIKINQDKYNLSEELIGE